MNKQEFIAISLFHNLKMVNKNYIPEREIIKSLTTVMSDNNIRLEHIVSDLNMYATGFKPIVLPLSDLVKEIRHNGEKFVPIDRIKDIRKIVNTNNYFIEDFIIAIRNQTISFDLMLLLIKWHFDVFGLIEKGEAIDVNRLEYNPYE